MTIAKENLQALRTYIASLDEATVMLDQVKCGACFCLIGHAATMPHFRKQGLMISASGSLWLNDRPTDYEGPNLVPMFGATVNNGRGLFNPYTCGIENYVELPGIGQRKVNEEDGFIAGQRVSHKELAIARLDYAISLEP